jgi:PAS domain S-box-containing protein
LKSASRESRKCRRRSEDAGAPLTIRQEWTQLAEFWTTCARAAALGTSGNAYDRTVSRIVEQAPVALSVVNRTDSLIRQVNPRFRELFGIGERDVIGVLVSEFYVDAADREMLLTRQKSGRIDMEIQFRRPDQSVFWAIVSSVEITFDDVPARLASFHDITERRRAEEELQRAKVAAEEANAAMARMVTRLNRVNAFKSEILEIVAHDLKNPLNVILGRTEMLSDAVLGDPVPLDKLRPQLDHIRASAKRLVEMVESLIADALADALDIKIRHDPVDLATLASDVAAAMRPLADEKKQTLTLVAPIPLITSGDYERLREAIDNIVSNAIKYTPIGGAIELAMLRADDNAVIRVRDSGPGLTKEDLTRMFTRFQRLSAKPTGGESSTGLGLAIAKKIVDLHGGDLTAESAGPGKGASFSVSLPLQLR